MAGGCPLSLPSLLGVRTDLEGSVSVLLPGINGITPEMTAPTGPFRNMGLSKAAQTHRLRKLRTPSKCRECNSYVYFQGAECEEVREGEEKGAAATGAGTQVPAAKVEVASALHPSPSSASGSAALQTRRSRCASAVDVAFMSPRCRHKQGLGHAREKQQVQVEPAKNGCPRKPLLSRELPLSRFPGAGTGLGAMPRRGFAGFLQKTRGSVSDPHALALVRRLLSRQLASVSLGRSF